MKASAVALWPRFHRRPKNALPKTSPLSGNFLLTSKRRGTYFGRWTRLPLASVEWASTPCNWVSAVVSDTGAGLLLMPTAAPVSWYHMLYIESVQGDMVVHHMLVLVAPDHTCSVECSYIGSQSAADWQHKTSRNLYLVGRCANHSLTTTPMDATPPSKRRTTHIHGAWKQTLTACCTAGRYSISWFAPVAKVPTGKQTLLQLHCVTAACNSHNEDDRHIPNAAETHMSVHSGVGQISLTGTTKHPHSQYHIA